MLIVVLLFSFKLLQIADLCRDLSAALFFSFFHPKQNNLVGQYLCVCVCVCHDCLQAGFDDLVRFMSSGPSHVLLLSRVEGSATVAEAWRDFIGPADVEEAKREKPERSVTGDEK